MSDAESQSRAEQLLASWDQDVFRMHRDGTVICEVIVGLLAENSRLTHLLGSHADGHMCTCTMISATTLDQPSEWEQDPWCWTHPDMAVILAYRAVVDRKLAEARA